MLIVNKWCFSGDQSYILDCRGSALLVYGRVSLIFAHYPHPLQPEQSIYGEDDECSSVSFKHQIYSIYMQSANHAGDSTHSMAHLKGNLFVILHVLHPPSYTHTHKYMYMWKVQAKGLPWLGATGQGRIWQSWLVFWVFSAWQRQTWQKAHLLENAG